MDAGISIEFRMEGGDELTALLGGNDMAIHLSQDLGLAIHLINIRSTDEGHRDMLTDSRDILLCIETAKLAAIGIAPHVNVHCAEVHR